MQSIKQSNFNIGKRIIDTNAGSGFPHLNDVNGSFTYQDWKVFYHILDIRMDDDIKFEKYKKAHNGEYKYSAEADCFYNCYRISKDEFIHSLKMLKNNLTTKERLIFDIKSSLTLTVITITLSLLFLPLCGSLCNINLLVIGITFITLALTVICLSLYASLIIKALGVGKKERRSETLLL